MSATAQFLFDSHRYRMLSKRYRSAENALLELVAAAWNSEARRVSISLPGVVRTDPLVIADDGAGMTRAELESMCLLNFDAQPRHRRRRTPQLKRPEKGNHKGLGRFAGLAVGSSMEIETRAHGQKIRVQSSIEAGRKERGVAAPAWISECTTEEHGTTITIRNLNQSLKFPDPARLRQALLREFGLCEDFVIEVNETPISLKDAPGSHYVRQATLPYLGAVRLEFVIAEPCNLGPSQGISMTVAGRRIGERLDLGVSGDVVFAPKLLAQLSGVLAADGLRDLVTADWAGVIVSSPNFIALKDWVRQQVRAPLQDLHNQAVADLHSRMQTRIEKEVNKFPAEQRSIARRYVEPLLQRLHGEHPERVALVMEGMFDSLARNQFCSVLELLERSGLSSAVDTLKDFNNINLLQMLSNIAKRVKVLNELDDLCANPLTVERSVHDLITSNVWVLGREYETLSSDRTIARVLGTCMEKRSARSKLRPDLFLGQLRSNEYLLVEFKHPSKLLTRDDEAQALKYRDELRETFRPISILILGKKVDGARASGTDTLDLKLDSYSNLISTARQRLDWLLKELNDPRASVSHGGLPQSTQLH